ncbi:hypothetical protein CC80DRAFT_554006 [Byssothecium circinans]|uniref:Ubiquitin-like protease family profile domain-containing protein n=1 Tax=Byssothecium circinans TaxID=147558 RepID=A0A6A5T8J2_9PLEO|nr:hypothetical protein CC80DRAFT_510984 [Byssothecium circinans]KAF1950858.1 hypothetical protein CC80DRAFT_554006 [Byssothecium circinans]
MPPKKAGTKRKATKQGGGKDPKKPKTKSTVSESPSDGGIPVEDRLDIQWVFPAQPSRGSAGVPSTVDSFTQALFNRPWGELHNLQTASLETAIIRSPVVPPGRPKVLNTGARVTRKNPKPSNDLDSIGASDAFRELFGRIERESNRDLGDFAYHHFVRAFAQDGDEFVEGVAEVECAVVASNGVPRPFSVMGNHTFKVTNARNRGKSNEESEAASIDLRPIQGADDAGLRYFVVVPVHTSVTVNASTFRNVGDTDELFIGPLPSFATIELLSQPIFFWQGGTTELTRSLDERTFVLDDVERKARHNSQNTENISTIWSTDRGPVGTEQQQPIEAFDPETVKKVFAGKSEAEIRGQLQKKFERDAQTRIKEYEVGRKEAIDKRLTEYEAGQKEKIDQKLAKEERERRKKAEEAAEKNTVDEARKKEIQAANQKKEKKEEAVRAKAEADKKKKEKQEAARQQLEQLAQGDGFIDRTTVLEKTSDFCLYLRLRLAKLRPIVMSNKEAYEDRIQASGFITFLVQLVPRAINNHNLNKENNPNMAGFATPLGDRLFLPGRPVLLPAEDTHLAIIQLSKKREISLHIIHPTADSKKRQRRSVRKKAKNFVEAHDWLNKIDADFGKFPDGDHSLWVAGVPRHDDIEISFRLMVLSAWALALGLALNPGFKLATENEEYFREQFDVIANLFAINLALDWKLIFAFLKCWNIVAIGVDVPEDDRRFQATAAEARKFEERENILMQAWKGRRGNALAPEKLDNGTMVLFTGELRRENDRWSNEGEPSGEESDSSSVIRVSDTSDSENEDGSQKTKSQVINPACAYLRDTLEQPKMKKLMGKDTSASQELDEKTIFRSVAAVIQAVDHKQEPQECFGVMTFDTLKSLAASKRDVALFGAQPMLLPYTVNGHSFLVVVQSPDTSRVSIAVFDSAPWLSRPKLRCEVYNDVKGMLCNKGQLDYLDGNFKPDLQANWITKVEAAMPWQTGYYTIMTAWAIALGLPVNPFFKSKHKTFRSCRKVIRAVSKGYADWRLIWSFLACMGFVDNRNPDDSQAFISDEIQVRRGNRFDLVLSESQLDRDIEKLARLPGNNTPRTNEIIRSIPVEGGMKHRTLFPTDTWSDEQIDSESLPRLVQHYAGTGTRISKLHVDELAVLMNERAKATTEEEKPRKAREAKEREAKMGAVKAEELRKEACKYVHDRIRKFRKNQTEDQRAQINQKAKHGSGLPAADLLRIITTVTLSISENEEKPRGYGVLLPEAFRRWIAKRETFASVLRPGRPLIVPYEIKNDSKNHMVLIVIQYNESNDPTISVMDSRPYSQTPAERQKVYQAAVSLYKKAKWWQHVHSSSTDDAVPPYATWYPCAIQSEGWTSGYHVIMNAWAKAFGLTVNTKFFQSWDLEGQFFQDLVQAIYITQQGEANSKFLAKFLECYRFVLSPADPKRKLDKTQKFSTDRDRGHVLQRSFSDENEFWRQNPQTTIDLEATRIRFEGQGQRHNSAFKSDDWEEQAVKDQALELARLGRLDPDSTVEEIEAAWKARDQPLDEVEGNEGANGNPINPDLLEVTKGVHEVLGVKDAAKKESDQMYIDNRPCDFLAQRMKVYDDLAKKTTFSPPFQFPPEEEYVDDWNVTLGIASVIEAIDTHQANSHLDSEVFAGGFALASSYNIAMGISRSTSLPENAVVSRPRRCWLMPITVGRGVLRGLRGGDETEDDIAGQKTKGDGRTHIFLAVVQEEVTEDEQTVFTASILDSLETYLQDVPSALFQRIRKAAADLGWSTHRNGGIDGDVTFTEDLRIVSVAQQDNGWRCGYHTILNAWILAMGLTPNRNFDLSSRFGSFMSILQLAIAGALDWKTLVAWFFCNQVTAERTMDNVPENRRFESSLRQKGSQDAGDIAMATRLENIYDQFEIPLGTLPRSERPYDHTNNVNFGNTRFVTSIRKCNIPDETGAHKFYKGFLATIGESWESDPEAMIQKYQGYMQLHDKSQDKRLENEINQSSCNFWNRSYEKYKALLMQKHVEPYVKVHAGTDLSMERLMAGVASVLEAIDQLQVADNGDPDRLFARGFTLATARAVENGKVETRGISSRPGRCWLMPRAFGGNEHPHIFLVVVQEELKDGKAEFSVYFLDSRPKHLKKHRNVLFEQTKKIVSSLGWSQHRLRGSSNTAPDYCMEPYIVQVPKEAKGVWQSGWNALMNAWILALGLTPSKTPMSAQAYLELAEVLRLAIAGVLDWRSLFAWLNCHDLVQEKMVGEVPADRRFSTTFRQSGSATLEDRLTIIRERESELLENVSTKVFPYFRSNNVHFNNGKWTFEGKGPSGSGDKGDDNDSAKSSKVDLSHSLRNEPCQKLRQAIDSKLQDQKVAKDLKTIRAPPLEVSMEQTLYLRLDEIVLAIASLTLAITKNGNGREGFSHVTMTAVQACADWTDESSHLLNGVSGNGRPLLVPIVYFNHAVLIVIQYDDQKVPTISIVDSRSYHYTREHRQTLYQIAIRLITKLNNPDSTNPPIPSAAKWIPCAMQSTNWTCGYHVIFNGWALALGLEPNMDFRENWTVRSSQLFRDALDVIHLARVGAADLDMITAFLRCYGFVGRGQDVDMSRRFTSTQRLMNEVDLEDEIAVLKDMEQFTPPTGLTPFASDQNRLTLRESGFFHNEKRASDDWDFNTRTKDAPLLASLGRLDLNADRGEIKSQIDSTLHDFDDSSNTVKAEYDDFISKIDETMEKQSEDSRRALLRSFQQHIQWERPENDARSNEHPCIFASGMVKRLNHLFNNQKQLQLSKGDQWVKSGEHWDQDRVVEGIASVVQAIDQLQHETYKKARSDSPFAGGFTLAKDIALQMALASRNSSDSGMDIIASRPRRCWLLPRVFDNKGRIHTFLTVLQEEKCEEGTEFRVYFLDSAPHHLRHLHRTTLLNQTQQLARNTSWAKHRNDEGDTQVKFSKDPREVTVLAQAGDWTCGLHTIMNAWILALGLTPQPNVGRLAEDTGHSLKKKMYSEFLGLIQLAVGGVLDWRTLVAWLFCWELTVETKVDGVPLDRRFIATVRQEGQSTLAQWVHDIFHGEDDARLASLSPTEVPYDHGNNVDFTISKERPWQFKDDDRGPGSQEQHRAFEDANEWDYESEDVEMVDWCDDGDGGLDFLNDVPDLGAKVAFLL